MIKLYLSKVNDVFKERNEREISTYSLKRRQSIAAEVLLEQALRELGIQNYQIKKGSNGKPYLDNYDNLYFNISHAKEYVAIAIADFELGIDIQHIKAISNLPAMLNRCCTWKEKEKILEAEEECHISFCRLWAIKESFLKYTGEGLSRKLDSFSIDFEKGQIEEGDAFFQWIQIEQYFLAICTKERIVERIEELVDNSFEE